MVRIGIVGKNYCESYASIINEFESYKLIGVFDPSFPFKYPNDIPKNLIYLSFEELAQNCDAIAFASPEKIYLPLIELALKYSKPIFLHSVHNLSLNEQIDLLKINEEANEVIQIHQPVIFHESFKAYQEICNNPLLLQYYYCDNSESKMLVKTRLITGAILSLIKSNVRKVTANTISVCNTMPDIIKVRIDFDNGSLAEIMVNSVENQKINLLKSFEYNGFYNIDLNANQLSGTRNSEKILINSLANNTIPQKILEKQLIDFYYNITCLKKPLNSIENEINTQEVIEKIKEKLRININIF